MNHNASSSIYRVDSTAVGFDRSGTRVEKPIYLWIVLEQRGAWHAANDVLSQLGCLACDLKTGCGQLRQVEAGTYGIYQVTMTVVRGRWDVAEVTMVLALEKSRAMEQLHGLGDDLGALSQLTRWNEISNTTHIGNFSQVALTA